MTTDTETMEKLVKLRDELVGVLENKKKSYIPMATIRDLVDILEILTHQTKR